MSRATTHSHWPVRTFLIWLVLACLLPGVIGASLFFMYDYRQSRAQQERNTIQTARALVLAVDSHLLRTQTVAQVLAASDSLAKHDLARFHRKAREVMEHTGLGSNVVLRDRAGRQVLNTALDFGQALPRHAAPEQVRRVFATGNPTISDVFVGPVFKRPIVSVDVPVVIDGKLTYALGVGILPRQFDAVLQAQHLPAHWVAGVLDSGGHIVGRSNVPPQSVGRKASATLLHAMETSPEGSSAATTHSGVPVLSFYSRSPVTRWSVGIGIPRSILQQALLLPLSMLATGVAMLFGIGLFLAWIAGGRIARSVKALTAPAVALGRGASAPLPRVHIREAAEVADAIARAARALKERDAALQARDAELAEAHRLARFGTWYWNPATGEVRTSPSLSEIYGREIPPFPEQRGTLLTVESWERVNVAAQRAMQGADGYDLELEINHGGGYTIWVQSKCEAVRNERNEIVALRGTIQDVTERKLAGQRLRESEEELRKFKFFSDYANDLHFLFDRTGRVGYANILAGEYLGYGDVELLQLNLSDIDPSYSEEQFHAVFLRGRQTRVAPFESVLQRKDRSQFPVEVTATVLEHKGAWLMFATARDITERKAHERALRSSERHAREAARQAEAERRRLGAVLEASPAGIVVADAKGSVLQDNVAHKRLWGANRPPTESVDEYKEWKGWWADGSARHGQPLTPQDWAMARALRGEEAREIVEIETFDTPPLRRTVIISGAPIRDDTGTIVGGVIAQMDITTRVAAEEALRQADRRKDEFLAMLAHELRNPLAPIAAAAHLLEFARLDEAGLKRTSAIIARQVKHMTGLVDDLLDVSRVTRGLVTLDTQKLDARDLVADAVEQVRPLIATRRHRLALCLPPEPAFVFGDPKRLVQVVSNLLNNAAKFTPEGGEIVLSLHADGDRIDVTVADSGVGMAPELVKRVFGLFVQGERSPDRAQGGLGIGLALAKSLVELHGGTVTASSAGPGQGSRFTVCLPRCNEPAEAVGVEQDEAGADAAGARLKVLVVDDNVDAAQTLAMFVEALGHQTSVEYSSRAALERAGAEAPDLCLLDIGLPEMNGNELARRLRADPRTERAILVAVTGYGQDHDRNAALAAGFDYHFVKPVDNVRLQRLLTELAKR